AADVERRPALEALGHVRLELLPLVRGKIPERMLRSGLRPAGKVEVVEPGAERRDLALERASRAPKVPFESLDVAHRAVPGVVIFELDRPEPFCARRRLSDRASRKYPSSSIARWFAVWRARIASRPRRPIARRSSSESSRK